MAQLKERQGDAQAAGAELRAALDLFERLGMRREVEEARATLDGQKQAVSL